MESSYAPRDAVDLLGDLPGWWVAGGWAIDLWLGRQTREHVDLDLATLRKDQRIFWRRLEGWDLHLVTAPGIVEPWPTPGTVPPPLHAVWCRQDVCDPAHAPGTGTPEPGGLTAREMLRFITLVAKEASLCGMEVVEVAPPYDSNEITSLLATRSILDILATMVAEGKIGRRAN